MRLPSSRAAGLWLVGALALAGCGGQSHETGSHAARTTLRTTSTRAPAAPLSVAVGASSHAWTALSDTPVTRTEVAAARLGEVVYVVGGFDQRSGSSTTIVERLDLRTGRWSLTRPMPLALNHMGVAAYGGSLYVLGGYRSPSDTNSDATNHFWRYDPETDQWSAMPPAPTPRAAFATAVLDGRLYAAAGRNDSTLALKSVDVFDFATQRWMSAPELNVAREHVAGVAAGGAVYVLGGRERGVGYFSTVERYVPGASSWQELAHMPVERSGFEAVAVPGRIVAVGGEAGTGVIGEVDSLNLATGNWETLPPMRTPRHGLGVVDAGRLLLTIEGGPVAGLSYSHEVERLLVR